MKQPRVLMIGLDGYEPSIAERLMEAGRLPALRSLRRDSARLRLDHGPAKRTGLAWEHVSSGLAPDDAKRWAAVHFDAERYEAKQEPTSLVPFPEHLQARTLVFDPPYFDLCRTRTVEGLVSWGAHDPGVAAASRPESLADEITARFGRYPAKEFIYGFVWPSEAKARAMAAALSQATALRGHIAEWLFCERLPTWDLGLMVVSEFHSAIEAMWHGVDPSHPLHSLPSAGPARDGIESVYEQADAMIARLRARLSGVRLVVFAMHGMGANNADVASMALLGELMYRHAFDAPHMREIAWPKGPGGVPLLTEGQGWSAAVAAGFDADAAAPPSQPGLAQKISQRLRSLAGKAPAAGAALSLGWMPVARYRPLWHSMPAFALPSFYDGRIRVNLAGREANGSVALEHYGAVLDGIETLLDQCRDVITRQPIVARVERAGGSEPLRLSPTGADLIIEWRGTPLGFDHPTLGRIGPLPYRRTGGHTGRHGFAYFCGDGIAAGDYGEASAFDVVPTAIDLLGESPECTLSGQSWKSRIASTASAGA